MAPVSATVFGTRGLRREGAGRRAPPLQAVLMGLGAVRQDHLQHALERRRGMVPQHRDLPVALRGEPVELNDTAFAGERLVTVPGIVAALEREQRARDRRNFEDDVVEVVCRAQQAQPAARLPPRLVHVDEDGDDLAF